MKNIYIFLLLIVAATAAAQITTPSAIYACDADGDGFAIFDLTSHNGEILNGEDPEMFQIRFYLSLANAGSNTDEILPPTAFTNTVANSQVVFVRVDDLANSMMSIYEMELFVSPAPTASITGLPASCVGDLGSVTITAQNGTPPYTVLYNVNGDPGALIIESSSGFVVPANVEGTYTVTVTSITDSSPQNCTVALNEQFSFEVSSPQFVQPPTLTVIEDPMDGIAQFDLTSQTPIILDGQSGLQVSYFLTEADATTNSNQLAFPEAFTNTTNPQKIWVNVEDISSGCFSITSFHVFVNSATDPIIYIPDPVFKANLIGTPNELVLDAAGDPVDVDINDDNEIQVSEAPAVFMIQMTEMNITNVEGVNSFPNLTFLSLIDNNISELDVSALNNLETLYVSGNNLSQLDVSGLDNLEILNVQTNNLTSLDFSDCPMLQNVACDENMLTSLDLTGLPSVKNFSCYDNALTELNLSGLTLLEGLWCNGNQISELDFTGLDQLAIIICMNNAITELNVGSLVQLNTLWCDFNLISFLDVSANTNLSSLSCGGLNLTSLDVSQNPSLCYLGVTGPSLQTLNLKNGNSNPVCNEQFDLYEMPNLQYVCTDAAEMDFFSNYFVANDMTNVNVNTYCSFLPGGDYNTITGTVRFDGDNNGCTAADSTQSLIKVRMNSVEGSSLGFTNIDGDYAFYTGAGEFSIAPEPEMQNYFDVFLPVSVSFPTVNNLVANQDFCLVGNGIHCDAEVTIAPLNPAQPGFSASYLLVYRNKGNQSLSGSVSFTFDSTLMSFTSATTTPTIQDGNVVGFNYSELLPFESRAIVITFVVNAPTATPPVNIGDILNFHATITHGCTEETIDDNSYSYDETVTGSYDPNNIICVEGESESTTAIGEYLHYIINFENTGTAPAQNIVVTQALDLTNFNLESLQLLHSSHPVVARVQNGICEFIFEGINLDSGGHGNILMKVRSSNALQNGDAVNNQADIFFDYNFPVATNIATTLFESLSINDPKADQSVQAYPNPTNGQITIRANSVIESIQLYDVQGRLLQATVPGNNEVILDVTNRSAGIYFLKVATATGTTTMKMIRS